MAYHLRALLASGALLLGSSAAALAASGVATTNVNVRSEPSERSQVLDVLPAGETVNLIGCDDEWCEIGMGRDGTGFVLSELLDIRGRPPLARFGGTRTTVVVEEDDPIVIRGLEIGGYWDNRPYYYRDGFYYWGGRWYGGRPGVGGWRDRSWRRWGDRDRSWRGRDDRPGDSRGGVTNRPPRIDPRTGRPDDGDGRFGRIGRGDRPDRGDRGDRPGRDDRGDRGDRFRGRGVDRSDPGGGRSGDARLGGSARSGDGRMEPAPRAEPRDRGDRMGLDRAGGGGGRGGDGGGRGGGGGGRGEGGGRDR